MASEWIETLIQGFLLSTGSQSPHAVHTMEAISTIFTSMWDVVDVIYGLFYDFSNILNILNGFLPGVWLDVILVGLGLIVCFRVYSFVSDISLFGFKI